VDVEDAAELDSIPPETQITSFIDDTGDGAFVTFEFDASEPSTFECSLDVAAFAACQPPVSYGPLGDGSHTFRVRAIDRAGNADPSPAEQTWTVDTAFSLSASPDTLTMAPEGWGTSTIRTTGSNQLLSLSASGQPATVAVWFGPSVMIAGGSSTMYVSVGAGAAPGTYPITVTGTGTTASHTTTVTLVVSASDFSISAYPLFLTVPQGSRGTATIGTSSLTAQTVALSADGVPDGTAIRFSPASVTAGGSSTMTVDVGPATLWGWYTLTVVGTGAGTTHTVTITLYVALSNNDFSSGAGPASLSVAQGTSRTSTIQTTLTSGSAQTVDLSASGQPAGTSVSFSPSSVTAGGSATMPVSVGSATVPGTYTITVTGTGASATHATTVALTVTAAPTARFTSSCTALTCSVDGSSSADPDGSIASYAWEFGDGASGSGRTATHTYSRAGSYTVTLTVTDDAGASGSTTRTVAPISLSARGYKQSGLQKVDLSWSGPSGVSFDVYRNSARIATVQASSYTDTVKKGHGTYTYTVCAPAIASCSTEATVIF